MTPPHSHSVVSSPPLLRLLNAILAVLSRIGPLALLLALLFFETRLTNQLRLMRAYVGFCLAPALAAWLLSKAFAVRVTLADGSLNLEGRGQRTEIPLEAITGLTVWRPSLPGAGFWLNLRSGRRFRDGLQPAMPVSFIRSLIEAGGDESLADATGARSLVYAEARELRRRPWYVALLKFPVFALVPTLPLFRLHQWITYGGTFGEYYTYGLEAYLLAFAIHWAQATIWLVLYAAALGAVTDLVCWAGSGRGVETALGVRGAAERVQAALYYGGVGAFLLRLYLASS